MEEILNETKKFYEKLYKERKHEENENLLEKLKSLSPIHFVKIRLSNFLGDEFVVKM